MSSEIEMAETSTAQEASVRRPDIGKRRADDSILRAPAHMRYDRKNDFEPKFVSIGPYYHGQPKFEPMETLKRQCLPYLLQKQPVADQKRFVQEFMNFERQSAKAARLFYKEKFDQGDGDFIWMLVNDSCFIIRVILSLSQKVQESMAFLDVNIKEVRSDLLLLENQIPLFFIKKVYTELFLTGVNPIFPHFETVLEPFIWFDMPWGINRDGMSRKAAHLLDLYWRCSTSETVNSFGRCLEKLINEPINKFLSILQAVRRPERSNMEKALARLESDFNLAMEQEIEAVGTFQIDFERAIHELANFQIGIVETVREQLGTFQFGFDTALYEEEVKNNENRILHLQAVMEQFPIDRFKQMAIEELMEPFPIDPIEQVFEKKMEQFRSGIEKVVTKQLETFQSGFQKVIDEQRPLIHKEVDDFGTRGGPSARKGPLNCCRSCLNCCLSCFEQGRNEHNIQSDIEQEMNEQPDDLSIGFDQVINKQLDYLGRPGLQGKQPSLVEIYCPTNEPKVIANATVLHHMAGVKFGKLNREHHHNGVDVIFSNGIMKMPFLKIDSCQKTLLVNLIAYENSKLPSMRTISSYIKLMDELIDSEKDVELLQQYGVISNTLSSHKMAATFFNDIGNFCLIDHKSNCFPGLYENVLKYYNSCWNRRRASLRQNYCSNPWAKISVCAGVTLLILTVLQTFFTMYAYFKPPK